MVDTRQCAGDVRLTTSGTPPTSTPAGLRTLATWWTCMKRSALAERFAEISLTRGWSVGYAAGSAMPRLGWCFNLVTGNARDSD